jgi:hypothetical protein
VRVTSAGALSLGDALTAPTARAPEAAGA